MSASLVGSEMCIRDRPLPSPQKSAQELRLWKPLDTKPGSGANSRLNEACLLYTSDAADDM
eukprot:15275288-Alexandrium_andersonii.AAC.1